MSTANKPAKHWSDKLVALNACGEAVRWGRKQKSPATAWCDCKRGDWMIWLIGKTTQSEPYSEERKPLVRVACECARLAWRWMPQASRDALETAERWTRGEATAEDCRKARAAVYADDAAVYADDAAYAAADAAYAAAAAAYAADDAAAAAAYGADDARAECADIVRRHYPKPPRLP